MSPAYCNVSDIFRPLSLNLRVRLSSDSASERSDVDLVASRAREARVLALKMVVRSASGSPQARCHVLLQEVR